MELASLHRGSVGEPEGGSFIGDSERQMEGCGNRTSIPKGASSARETWEGSISGCSEGYVNEGAGNDGHLSTYWPHGET
jgi:hypothetical protein